MFNQARINELQRKHWLDSSDLVHLAGGVGEYSDLVDRVASSAGVRISRAPVLSAIPRHLAHHAAHFSARRVFNWQVEMERLREEVPQVVAQHRITVNKSPFTLDRKSVV